MKIIGYIILFAVLVWLSMSIFEAVWNSDMPMWLKVFLLK